jgi:hypothetical protein
MALVLQEEEDDDQPSKPTGCQLAIGIKARTIAASAVAAVLLLLAVTGGGDAATTLAHHLAPRSGGLPHALCAAGAHTVVLDDDSSQSWRQLQVNPVAYRDTASCCDSAARTGVGGGSEWLRLPGVLPTQPMRAVRGACGSAGAAWVSGWAPGVSSSPPVNFHAPGSYPGDGPQDPDSFAAQQVICFERERPAASMQPPRRARPLGVGTMEPGVLWEVWPMHSSELRALRSDFDFPNNPTTQLLVQPGDTPGVADSPTEFHTGGRVPVTQTTTFSQLYSNKSPQVSGGLGCITVDLESAGLARSSAACSEYCAATPLCRFFFSTAEGRCCFKRDYDLSDGFKHVPEGYPENAFYALRTRAAIPRDGPSVSAPFSILKPLMKGQEGEALASGTDVADLDRNGFDRTGTRMRAYFRPPATGNYTFAGACLGECEIWLAATPGAPSGAEDIVQVAPVPGDVPTPGPAWDTQMPHAEPQWLEEGRYYLLVVIAAQLRYASLRVSVAGLPVAEGADAAAQQPAQQPLEVASMGDYLYTDAGLRSDALQRGEDGRDHDASTYESCAVSVTAAVLNCGDFLLWRLPDAPGCSGGPSGQSEQTPEQSLGYCTVPWTDDMRRRLQDGVRGWVTKWLGLSWWHSV